MTHWSDAYVGRPYTPGTGDCAALAETVAREVLGLAVSLPPSHAVTYREQARQIHQLRDEYAARVATPADGQPALFEGRGRTCHIGVMCLIGADWWVLHARQDYGSVVRERLRAMTQVHFRLEGYYRWL